MSRIADQSRMNTNNNYLAIVTRANEQPKSQDDEEKQMQTSTFICSINASVRI